MKISDDHKKVIINDFYYAADMMKNSKFLEEKLFFYSSTFGTLQRILNLQYNPDLVFAHLVFSQSYTLLMARIGAMKSGDPTVQFPSEEAFDVLANCVREAANKIDSTQDLLEVFKKVAEIAYASTGNGYYLLKKGVLKI